MIETWTVALEFVKASGISALAGVVVGSWATRGQKKHEALQGIRSANYREVVVEYRRLTAQLQKFMHGAYLSVNAARVVQIARLDATEAEVKTLLNIESGSADCTSLAREIHESIAHILVHRTNATFHSYLRDALGVNVGKVTGALGMLRLLPKHGGYLEEADKNKEQLKESIQELERLWAHWKANAEKEAAGMRPTFWRKGD